MNSPRLFFASRSAGFTLVELLVSVSILALIMVILIGMTNQISQTWRSTTGKIEQFQEARDGFESMTRKLSQATLNTYWDLFNVKVGGRDVPKDFLRQSELRFISGPMSELAPNAMRPTHGVFFQAPLGFAEDEKALGGLENLLNTWGYFIEIGDDADSRPSFLQNRVPIRWRTRLVELMQPTEKMSVYDLDLQGKPDPGPNIQRDLSWFRPALSRADRSVRVVAENIVALIIWPKLSKQEEDARRDAGKSVLSPNYLYDSSLRSFRSARFGSTALPIYLNKGAKMVSASDLREASEINPKNQLPPVVQVTMVALDETSAARFKDAEGNDASLELVKGLFEEACVHGTRANQETKYEQDLKEMEKRMVDAKLTYRIFTTNVAIRGAKWSSAQTK